MGNLQKRYEEKTARFVHEFGKSRFSMQPPWCAAT